MICKDCIHNNVCKYGENRSNGMYCTGEKCKQYQSTADVVEVVRCKDCKYCDHCYPVKNKGEKAREGYYCNDNKRYVSPSGYCSYGERKSK